MRPSTAGRPLAALVLALGVAQAVLIALTVVRILDPGWVTVDALGSIVGLGMASAALAWTMCVPSRDGRTGTSLGVLGILAGLIYFGVWLSLFGGTFYTDDALRSGLAVGCDVLFAIWLIAAVRMTGADAPRAGVYEVMTLLSLRAVGELLLYLLLLAPSSGGLGPNLLVILVAGLVLVGWIVLAAWEISLGVQLIRAGRGARGGVQASGSD